MLKKQFLCICCPTGCRLTAERENETAPWRISGNRCPRGAAYAQAAEDTEDVCLRELFQRLSRAEYGHAAMLLRLLENSLTSGNNLLK